jgi:hypothetical protein
MFAQLASRFLKCLNESSLQSAGAHRQVLEGVVAVTASVPVQCPICNAFIDVAADDIQLVLFPRQYRARSHFSFGCTACGAFIKSEVSAEARHRLDRLGVAPVIVPEEVVDPARQRPDPLTTDEMLDTLSVMLHDEVFGVMLELEGVLISVSEAVGNDG